MSNTGGTARPTGTLGIKVMRGGIEYLPAIGPGKSWRLRNTMRKNYIMGKLRSTGLFKRMVHALGGRVIEGELKATLYRANGEVVDYGVISRHLITDVGVDFLVDDWDDDTTDITLMNFHGCGTGGGAEAVGDTALTTESTTILNPDSTRATGAKTQAVSNALESIGTLTFDGAGAIIEHGLFSTSGTGTGVLWDRSIFSAINVVSGDSIQFTYTCTISSGG